MSYHDLSECTLSADERLEEARRIIIMLQEEAKLTDLKPNELSMMHSVLDHDTCSVKQLFWFRDIKERVM